MNPKMFIFHCLLFIIQCSVLSAQDITVSGLEVKSGTPTTVMFNVSWSRTAALKDSAWVIVDYNNQGTMTRLLVTGVTASAGTVHKPSDNNQGAWIVTNSPTTGDFSAIVQLLAETAPADFHGACAYAISYPPVGQYTAANKINFTGTPDFYLTYSDGSAATVTKEKANEYELKGALVSFTDVSKAPGIFACALPASQTLTASAAGFCAGASGVQFALSNTQSGATYQLIRDNATVVATLSGTGSAATFSGPFTAEGAYTAKTEAGGAFCAVTMSGSHTVTRYQLPSIKTTPPSTICYNTTTSLSATASGGTTPSMTYTWVIGGVSGTTTAASTITKSLTTNTNYTVSVKNAYGCTATTSVATIPVATNLTQGTPAASPSSICYNGTATVNLAAASGGLGNITYKWQQSSDNSNWSDAAGTNNTQNYTTPALTASLYYRRVATSPGCNSINSAGVLVTVRQAFKAGSISTTGQAICSGAAVNQITNVVDASGGDGTITRIWVYSGTSSNTFSNSNAVAWTPTALQSSPGTYTITRWAKDNTCNTAYSQSSGQWVLTVNALPTTTSLTPNPATICVGETSILTALPAGVASYSFDGGSSWQSTASKVVAPSTTTGYILKVKSAAGCVSSDSKAATVNVDAKPANVTIQPSGTTVCSGQTATLTVGASPATKWQWNKGGSVTTEGSGFDSATYTTAPLTATTTDYSVTIFNNTCSVVSDPVKVSIKADGCCIDFVNFAPTGSESVGTEWTLCDNREANATPANPQSYKVKKMADNRIWMVQDLKFGNNCSKATFSGSSSDQKSSKLTSISGYIYGDCRSNAQPGAGYLYDWAAAIQKAGAYYGTSSDPGCTGTASGTGDKAPGACQGICPVGWHIPTATSSGEYQTLHNAIGDCSTGNDDCWDGGSAWEGVLGGRCDSGGSLDGQGDYADYWSSTYYGNSSAYHLYFDSGLVRPTAASSKHSGFSVRCVRNY
jgi:uncharacterized protein (TIGR02145 family)